MAFMHILEYLYFSTAQFKMEGKLFNTDMFREISSQDMLSLDADEESISNVNEAPFIKVRRHVTLVSFGEIRCFVTHFPNHPTYSVLYLIFRGEKSQQVDWVQQHETVRGNIKINVTNKCKTGIVNKLTGNQKREKYSGDTFELHAYRAIFEVVLESFEKDFLDHKEAFAAIERKIKASRFLIPSEDTDELTKLHETVQSLFKSLSLHRQRIEELLSQPMAIAMMVPTTSYPDTASPLDIMRHANLQFVDGDEAVDKAEDPLANQLVVPDTLRLNLILVNSCEGFKNIEREAKKLEFDIKRQVDYVETSAEALNTNNMILNTRVTIISMFIGFCGYITGLFGMNLDNGDWGPGWSFHPSLDNGFPRGGFFDVFTFTMVLLTAGSYFAIQMLSYNGWSWLEYFAVLPRTDCFRFCISRMNREEVTRKNIRMGVEERERD